MIPASHYVTPHPICNEILFFNCKAKDLVKMQVQRAQNGDLDYVGYWPRRDQVLLQIETPDGLTVFFWAPR